MGKISIGKIRGLQQIASPDGIFTMCAMDHRDSMRTMIDEDHPETVDYAQMVKHKLELCSALAPYSSAVLLDPIYGAAQCIAGGVLPDSTGLLVSIEATGYEGGKESRLTRLLDDWGVEKIKRMGASAVKILVYYRPDLADLAKQQRDIVAKVAQDCIKYDIPYLVEPKSYPVGDEAKNKLRYASVLEDVVIKTAEEITALPIDVLKAEFPADIHYKTDRGELLELCRRLDAASRVPWVILSAGVDFELFYRQVEIACQAGASGFLGGRAVWQEAMPIDDPQERVRYLEIVAQDRMRRLSEIAVKYGTPWYKKLGLSASNLTATSEDWYQKY